MRIRQCMVKSLELKPGSICRLQDSSEIDSYLAIALKIDPSNSDFQETLTRLNRLKNQ